MSKPHKKKYLVNLVMGFATVSAGIFVLTYAGFQKSSVTDWYFWAVIGSAVICAGLYFLLNAVVHRIKADLIRRQKSKYNQKSVSGERDDLT